MKGRARDHFFVKGPAHYAAGLRRTATKPRAALCMRSRKGRAGRLYSIGTVRTTLDRGRSAPTAGNPLTSFSIRASYSARVF